MSFAEIIGQPKPLAILRSALANGRLHHAYLFLGPEGVGKRAIALALAKAIHCAGANGDFCGQCVNCKRIGDGNHPDVRLVEPLAGRKEIAIQQIRDIEKELNYQSFTGGRKIVIFDRATLMNLSSQNALLKTLEEPPADSLLILIAANGGALLPTLRSRCLKVSFGPLHRPAVAQYLERNKQVKTEEAQFLAALSMGSLGLALKLNDRKLFEKRREWAALLGSLGKGDYRSGSDAAEKLAGNKDDALKFLEWAETFYRDLLVFAAVHSGDELINLDLLKQTQQLAGAVTVEKWLALFEQAVGAGARIQRNLNRRMVLEDLLFNVVGAR
ncbi:MAG: DNA polymerase III subunit delta' [Deltaproteobacteria bacterium]|nr:DNA polymerase III subunit delta' [Deltaproteobacteria bacterium]